MDLAGSALYVARLMELLLALLSLLSAATGAFAGGAAPEAGLPSASVQAAGLVEAAAEISEVATAGFVRPAAAPHAAREPLPLATGRCVAPVEETDCLME